MASLHFVYVLLLRIVLLNLLINYSDAYTEYTVENDRICSPLTKKRKIKLGYNERSGLVLRETRYFNHWPGTFDFNCRFEVEAISKDGLVAVIQKLYLRRNETTGECIDYIEFKPEHGFSEKVCGAMSTQMANSENIFMDNKGELEVSIYVKKIPLKQNEKIDIDIVFTAYKFCAANPIDYRPCSLDICMWKGFFGDGRVNCPFSDCIDEPNCDVKASSGFAKKETSSSPWYYALLVIAACTIFLFACLYLVFHKRHRVPRQRDVSAAAQQLTPSAPPLADSVKDQPPSYDSLYPDNQNENP